MLSTCPFGDSAWRSEDIGLSLESSVQNRDEEGTVAFAAAEQFINAATTLETVAQVMQPLDASSQIAADVGATSVTVVVHGADFSSGWTIPWIGGPLNDLGEALFTYFDTVGTVAQYSYDHDSGDLQIENASQIIVAPGTIPEYSHKIVVFDWSVESNDMAPGYDEAAGDALFAMLVSYNLTSSDYLHLIGHSRGAVVVSEAAQRLLHYGFPVDQMTLLDAEPGPGVYATAGKPYAWDGIGFVDNYYGDGTPWQLRVLRGEDVDGARNVHLLGESHSGVLDEYTSSIGRSQIGDPPRDGGFIWRAQPELQGSQSNRTPLTPPPDIINGNFTYYAQVDAITDDDFAGWAMHGGKGDADTSLVNDNWVLNLKFGETTRTHNRLYVPTNATEVAFKLQRKTADFDDFLEVLMDDTVIETIALNAVDTDPRGVAAPIPVDFRGSVHMLTFRSVAPGWGVAGSVLIDDIEFTETVAPRSYPVLPSTIADGFSFPVGNRQGDGTDGYRVSYGFLAPDYPEHPGEDWNRGSGDDDKGEPVYAVANGVVVEAKNFFGARLSRNDLDAKKVFGY